MKIRSILSKEDSFRSLPSNDELEGYKEDVRFLVQISTEKIVLIICDFHRAMSVGLGVSTDSIGKSGGWMVRKGMHTRQFLQQRTDTDDQTGTGETWTPLLNMYKAQMQFCEDSKLMKVFLEVVRSLYELL